MSKAATKVVRCAIYTRKSSEEGLDQAFNSLQAQREACEAYVKSQAGEGWRVLPAIYDDGGFSGGTLVRPALERLLSDVDAGRLDIIVVYKVDRLTRALSDFAKIVDRLDAAGASFVSVTQAFNTTTSMGRLTLNVLLSFAQFEREVTGERIRDKIAASKAKGMWMGGNLPLGYDAPTDLTTRALVVNPAEAEIVRGIFQTYLELGSVHALAAKLEAEGVRSKVCRTPAGRVRGGGLLSRGALFYLLKNRVYVGEIPHRDTSYPGAHSAIVDSEVFDAAQQMLADHRQERSDRPTRAASMVLRGRLFDVDGAPMSPSFTYRGQRIYRYYVSAPLQQGGKMAPRADAVRRVPAPEIEGLVQRELQRRFGADDAVEPEQLFRPVKRVDVDALSIRITLVRKGIAASALSGAEILAEDPKLAVVTVPIRCRLRGGRTWLTAPHGMPATQRVHRDAVLIRALRAAHRTVAEMGFRCGDGGFEAGQKLRLANTHERRLCRLAFLAPDIQQRIMDGHQPLNMTLERLVKDGVPTSWAEQRRRFGLQK